MSKYKDKCIQNLWHIGFSVFHWKLKKEKIVKKYQAINEWAQYLSLSGY